MRVFISLLVLTTFCGQIITQEIRGGGRRRQRVLRRRPTSIQNLGQGLEEVRQAPAPRAPVPVAAPQPIPAAPVAAPVAPTAPLQAVPQVQSLIPAPQIITDTQCPEKEGLQLYPHPDSCNNFYKCANGTLTLETCGNGLLFDERKGLAGSTHNHCSYIWEADCGGRKNDSTPISTPGCEYQFGIYPSGAGCFASYTKCVNGQPLEQYCQLGLAYDHRIHTCNWPDLLVESAGCDPSAALGDFRCPSDEELSPLAKRFFPFPRFPVPQDDTLFIICVNGMPRLNTCGQGTFFSEETLGCVEGL